MTNAIILAAGSGSRLRPYTDDKPKCMVPLSGIPLIERQLAALKTAGITDVTVVVGYRSEAFQYLGLPLVVNPYWETTNMVETLFCAESVLTDDTIVAYADIVYEPRVITALMAAPHEVSVVVDTGWRSYWQHRFTNPLDDAESLRLDEKGRIIDIGNKVNCIDDIEAQYIGLMRYRGAGIPILKNTRAALGHVFRPWMAKRSLEKAYMTDLLMEMVLMGHPPNAVPIDHGWIEIDTVTDYESAQKMIADGSITRFYQPFPA